VDLSFPHLRKPIDRAKLLSITMGLPSDLETRSKKNYYDADSLKGIFPEHAYDEMMEDTGGVGPVRSDDPDYEAKAAALMAGEESDDVV
jgi:hypothetical protein